jgi:hypothetical protein
MPPVFSRTSDAWLNGSRRPSRARDGVDCASWSRQTFRHANHAAKTAPLGHPGMRERAAALGGRGSRTGITPFEWAMHQRRAAERRDASDLGPAQGLTPNDQAKKRVR